MKICCICGAEKSVEDFNKKKDGFQPQCRDCGKEKSKEYYRSNRAAHIKAVGIVTKRIRERNKERILNYLSSHPCVDCGESDVIVLEFDHVRGKKLGNISTLVNHGHSWFTIQEEIKKCEVRCANDHRRVTAKRRLSLADPSGRVPVF